jgi:hypothetical protein
VDHGVPTPSAAFPDSYADVREFAATARFPVVAKNREAFERRRRPAVGGTTRITGRRELLALAAGWGPRPGVIPQEYLPREDAEDWIVHAYFDAESTPLAMFTGVEVRSWPPHAGMTACAYVVGRGRAVGAGVRGAAGRGGRRSGAGGGAGAARGRVRGPDRQPRLRPESPFGRAWSLYALSYHAAAFRRLPTPARRYLVRTVLGPLGAWWLRERFAGRVQVTQGQRITWVEVESGGRVALSLRGGGRAGELAADHVMAATGYRMNVAALGFLGPELRAEVVTRAGGPWLDAGWTRVTAPPYRGCTAPDCPRRRASGRSCGSSAAPSTPRPGWPRRWRWLTDDGEATRSVNGWGPEHD